uniref:Uncharacterized protein n=1 Tax=Chromera velia CCMP2878 TaxID=1169474 RepID=A0A0G4HJY5_9ALVE|eukprot:Cvel_7140.t1-p1 / transcript=Cvel_7140.t1 / gene=Cvel_7140 / organism=Chromera_velia_CCMP2878 / gene_product=hypothetical protein / transcript_product=hypothetical protein / location=Cvel_scaffold366:85941-90654(+) / protein_length=319 / sequence_SO=supercontig / SO=protein_coding / is_pseudo=false
MRAGTGKLRAHLEKSPGGNVGETAQTGAVRRQQKRVNPLFLSTLFSSHAFWRRPLLSVERKWRRRTAGLAGKCPTGEKCGNDTKGRLPLPFHAANGTDSSEPRELGKEKGVHRPGLAVRLLDDKENSIGPEEAREVFPVLLPSLESLCLMGSGRDDQGWEGFLRHLDLKKTGLRKEGLQSLCGAIKERGLGVETLNLSGNGFGEEPSEDQAWGWTGEDEDGGDGEEDEVDGDGEEDEEEENGAENENSEYQSSDEGEDGEGGDDEEEEEDGMEGAEEEEEEQGDPQIPNRLLDESDGLMLGGRAGGEKGDSRETGDDVL